MQISFNGSVLEFTFYKNKSTYFNKFCSISPNGQIAVVDTIFKDKLLVFFVAGRFADQFQYRFDTRYASTNYVMKTIENRTIEII